MTTDALGNPVPETTAPPPPPAPDLGVVGQGEATLTAQTNVPVVVVDAPPAPPAPPAPEPAPEPAPGPSGPSVDWGALVAEQGQHLARVAAAEIQRAEEVPQVQAAITNAERLLDQLYALKNRALSRFRQPGA